MLAFIEAEDLSFDTRSSVGLDKAMPVLSYLIGSDAGERSLYYSECLELGDAALRGFLPEDAVMFLRRIQDKTVSKRLADVDWQAEIAGQVYPFRQDDTKQECVSYISHFEKAMETYLARLVERGHGMITVEA